MIIKLNQHTSDIIKSQNHLLNHISIIKELIENALDAKATIIKIYINKEVIKIEDNGIGMISNNNNNNNIECDMNIRCNKECSICQYFYNNNGNSNGNSNNNSYNASNTNNTTTTTYNKNILDLWHIGIEGYTSKHSMTDYLLHNKNINEYTLGYKGQALSLISKISNVSIITSNGTDSYKININNNNESDKENGNKSDNSDNNNTNHTHTTNITRTNHTTNTNNNIIINDIKYYPRDKGTTITIENIFYNCNLRKNLLNYKKSISNINKLIESYLPMYNINIIVDNNKYIINKKGYRTPIEYMKSRKNIKYFIHTEYKCDSKIDGGSKIGGSDSDNNDNTNHHTNTHTTTNTNKNNDILFYLILGYDNINNNDIQHIYHNNRPITNKRISKIINNTFNIFRSNNPIFFIMINSRIDLLSVDKKEVIVEEENIICNRIKEVIEKEFSNNNGDNGDINDNGINDKDDISDKGTINDNNNNITSTKNNITSTKNTTTKNITTKLINITNKINTNITNTTKNINKLNKPLINKYYKKNTLHKFIDKINDDGMLTPVSESDNSIYNNNNNNSDSIGRIDSSINSKDNNNTSITITDNKNKRIKINNYKDFKNKYYNNYDNDNNNNYSSNNGNRSDNNTHTTINNNHNHTTNHINNNHTNNHTNMEISNIRCKVDITISSKDFLSMRILGNFNCGFILCLYKKYLIIFDQHAVSEIYNYEKYRKYFNVQKQRLIINYNNNYMSDMSDNDKNIDGSSYISDKSIDGNNDNNDNHITTHNTRINNNTTNTHNNNTNINKIYVDSRGYNEILKYNGFIIDDNNCLITVPIYNGEVMDINDFYLFLDEIDLYYNDNVMNDNNSDNNKDCDRVVNDNNNDIGIDDNTDDSINNTINNNNTNTYNNHHNHTTTNTHTNTYTTTYNKIIYSKIDRIMASRACRNSVMIGDCINIKKMEELIYGLAELERPWNCPHGRPTFKILGSIFN